MVKYFPSHKLKIQEYIFVDLKQHIVVGIQKDIDFFVVNIKRIIPYFGVHGDIVIDKLNEYKNIISFIAMIIAGYVWIEANFVDTGELKEYRRYETESEYNYYKDKQLRLEQEDKKLNFEDMRRLERLKDELKRLQK